MPIKKALVIGNADYEDKSFRDLPACTNDHLEVGRTLKEDFGFDVTNKPNCGHRGLSEALMKFVRSYRSDTRRSHGVVDKAGNYCAVPTDFTLPAVSGSNAQSEPAACTSSRLVNLRTRFVRKLIAQEDSQKDLPGRPAKGCAIVVLLDMCRSPIFEAKHSDPVKDLAPPFVNLVAVLFACAPDQVAKCGPEYSLWTQHLLAELPQPHNSLFEMNQRIAERMRDQTPGFHYVHYNQCYSFAKEWLPGSAAPERPTFSPTNAFAHYHPPAGLLQEALKCLCSGQNVFLWGAPGTGKTKFTEALMHELYTCQGRLAARYPHGGYVIPWGRWSRVSNSEHAHHQARKVKLHNMASKLGVTGSLETDEEEQVPQEPLSEEQIAAAVEKRFRELQALIIIDDVGVHDHPLLASDNELGFVGRQWGSCCVVTSTHDTAETAFLGCNGESGKGLVAVCDGCPALASIAGALLRKCERRKLSHNIRKQADCEDIVTRNLQAEGCSTWQEVKQEFATKLGEELDRTLLLLPPGRRTPVAAVRTLWRARFHQRSHAHETPLQPPATTQPPTQPPANRQPDLMPHPVPSSNGAALVGALAPSPAPAAPPLSDFFSLNSLVRASNTAPATSDQVITYMHVQQQQWQEHASVRLHPGSQLPTHAPHPATNTSPFQHHPPYMHAAHASNLPPSWDAHVNGTGPSPMNTSPPAGPPTPLHHMPPTVPSHIAMPAHMHVQPLLEPVAEATRDVLNVSSRHSSFSVDAHALEQQETSDTSSATLGPSYSMQRVSGNPFTLHPPLETRSLVDTSVVATGTARALVPAGESRVGCGAWVKLPWVPRGLKRGSKPNLSAPPPLHVVHASTRASSARASAANATLATASSHGMCFPILACMRQPLVEADYAPASVTADGSGPILSPGNVTREHSQQEPGHELTGVAAPEALVRSWIHKATVPGTANASADIPCGPGQLGSEHPGLATLVQLEVEPERCEKGDRDTKVQIDGWHAQWDVAEGGKMFEGLLEELEKASIVEATEASAFRDDDMKFVSVQALLQEYLSRSSSPISNPANDPPFPIFGYIHSRADPPSASNTNSLDASSFPQSDLPECSKQKLQWVAEVQPPKPGTTVLLPLRVLLPHVLMSLYGDAELLASGGFGVPEWVSRGAEFVTAEDPRLDGLGDGAAATECLFIAVSYDASHSTAHSSNKKPRSASWRSAIKGCLSYSGAPTGAIAAALTQMGVSQNVETELAAARRAIHVVHERRDSASLTFLASEKSSPRMYGMPVAKSARDALVAFVVAAMNPAGARVSDLPQAFIQQVCGSLAQDNDRPQGALCALALLHYRISPAAARVALIQDIACSSRLWFGSGRTGVSRGFVSTGTNGAVSVEGEEAAGMFLHAGQLQNESQSVFSFTHDRELDFARHDSMRNLLSSNAPSARPGMGSRYLSPPNSIHERNYLGSQSGAMRGGSRGLPDETSPELLVDASLGKHVAKFVPAICTDLTRLRNLSLSGLHSLEDVHLSGVTALKSLVRLCLRDCSGLRDACLGYIAVLNQLQRLDLSHCTGMSAAGLVGLLMPAQGFNNAQGAHMYSSTTTATAHSVPDNNEKHPKTGSAEPQFMHSLPYLISLKLQGMPAVTAHSMHAVAESYSTSLQVLDVSNCCGVWRSEAHDTHAVSAGMSRGASGGGALQAVGMLHALRTLRISVQHTAEMAVRDPVSGRVAVAAKMHDGDDAKAQLVQQAVMSCMEETARRVGWELVGCEQPARQVQPSSSAFSTMRSNQQKLSGASGSVSVVPSTAQPHAPYRKDSAHHGNDVEPEHAQSAPLHACSTTEHNSTTSTTPPDLPLPQPLLAPLATLSALTSLTLCTSRAVHDVRLQSFFPPVLSVADCSVLGSLPALASLDLSVNELSREHLHALRSPLTLRAFTLRRCSLQGFEREEVSRCGGGSPHTHANSIGSTSSRVVQSVHRRSHSATPRLQWGTLPSANRAAAVLSYADVTSSTSTTTVSTNRMVDGSTNAGMNTNGKSGAGVVVKSETSPESSMAVSQIGPAKLTSLTLESCRRIPESFWKEWVASLSDLVSLTIAPHEEQLLPGLSYVSEMSALTMLDLCRNAAVTEELFDLLQEHTRLCVLLLRDCRGCAAMMQPNRAQPPHCLKQFIHKQATRARAATTTASTSNGHNSSSKSKKKSHRSGSDGSNRCTLRLLDLRGCAKLAIVLSQGSSHVPAARAGASSLGNSQGNNSTNNHSMPEEAREEGVAGLLTLLRSHGCTVLD